MTALHLSLTLAVDFLIAAGLLSLPSIALIAWARAWRDVRLAQTSAEHAKAEAWRQMQELLDGLTAAVTRIDDETRAARTTASLASLGRGGPRG